MKATAERIRSRSSCHRSPPGRLRDVVEGPQPTAQLLEHAGRGSTARRMAVRLRNRSRSTVPSTISMAMMPLSLVLPVEVRPREQAHTAWVARRSPGASRSARGWARRTSATPRVSRLSPPTAPRTVSRRWWRSWLWWSGSLERDPAGAARRPCGGRRAARGCPRRGSREPRRAHSLTCRRGRTPGRRTGPAASRRARPRACRRGVVLERKAGRQHAVAAVVEVAEADVLHDLPIARIGNSGACLYLRRWIGESAFGMMIIARPPGLSVPCRRRRASPSRRCSG